MATAIVLNLGTDAVYEPEHGIRYNPLVFYFDENLGIAEGRGIFMYISPTATPTQIENTIEDAILQGAAENYPGMVLARNDLIYPDIKRGQ